MIKIRRSELVAGMALSCGMFFATTSFGQIIVRSDVSAAAPQHLGSGPIDRNNLSADILNCEVCRQRLGLPFGARVMSAEVRGQKTGSVKVQGSETVTAQKIGGNSANQSELPKVRDLRSLGAAGIETVLEAAAADVSIQTNPQPKPPAETAAPIPADAIPAAPTQTDSANELAKERENLKVQLEQMQFEWKKRLEQANAANKEVLTLLEKRTAEVTELQLQLKSQQEALSKAKQEAQSKDKPDIKRKAPNRGKKPAKPSIDT